MKKLFDSDLARAVVPLALLMLLLGAWRAGVMPAPVGRLLDDAANAGPSALADELLTRNYYEAATDMDRSHWQAAPPARDFAGAVSGWLRGAAPKEDDQKWVPLDASGLTRKTGGFVPFELVPNLDSTFKGKSFRTNRWGQRDSDIEKAKPAGTCRIALVGASNTMGAGVAVEETYAERTEQRLQSELGGRHAARYEVVNFSVGGYQLLDRVHVAEHRIPEFQPDLILVDLTMHDLRWMSHERVAEMILEGRPMPFPFLDDIIARAGVEPGDSRARLRHRLRPFREALVTGCLGELRGLQDRTGIPVGVIVLRIEAGRLDPALEEEARLVEQAGLIALPIFSAYEGRTPDEMHLRPTDHHPTPLAHRLIADELVAKMLADRRVSAVLTRDRMQPPGAAPAAPDGQR